MHWTVHCVFAEQGAWWLWWSTDCLSFLMTKYLQNYWHVHQLQLFFVFNADKQIKSKLNCQHDRYCDFTAYIDNYLPNSSVCIITVSVFKAQSTAGWNYSLSVSIVRQQTVHGIFNMDFLISYITVWLTSDFIHAAIWIIVSVTRHNVNFHDFCIFKNDLFSFPMKLILDRVVSVWFPLSHSHFEKDVTYFNAERQKDSWHRHPDRQTAVGTQVD